MRPRALLITAALAALATPAIAQDGFAAKPRKVSKTDAEWAKLLSRDQFLVTRKKETEPAFSGKLVNNHARGVYECVCCGLALFSSRAKFESGTGWPSFWQPIATGRVDSAPDYSYNTVRTEVLCHDCGAHLGHVFDDGPPPTGLRFCINSLSLKFAKDSGTAADSKTSKKAKTAKKAKTDEKAKPDEKTEPESSPSEKAKPAPDDAKGSSK